MTDRMKGAVWDKYFLLDDKSPSGLTWKESRGTVKAGSAAGSVLKSARKSYYITRVMRIGYLVHRIIFEMTTGKEIPPGMEIDHIDGNGYRATINDLSGKAKSMYFEIKKYGESESLRRAIEWRACAIEELNKLGAGYTSNHGSIRK